MRARRGSARAWVVFIVGIIAVYIVYIMMGGALQFIFGVYEYTKAVANQSGVQFDPLMDQTMSRVRDFVAGFWHYSLFIVFVSMIVYVVLESMRRRPEDYYF